jgi:hypothetical protein
MAGPLPEFHPSSPAMKGGRISFLFDLTVVDWQETEFVDRTADDSMWCPNVDDANTIIRTLDDGENATNKPFLRGHVVLLTTTI